MSLTGIKPLKAICCCFRIEIPRPTLLTLVYMIFKYYNVNVCICYMHASYLSNLIL